MAMRDDLGRPYGGLALATDEEKVLGIHRKNILGLKWKGHGTKKDTTESESGILENEKIISRL